MTFARTKIQAPRPRATCIERGALESRLAQALAAQRVALVCAPAGYGKTTLLVRALGRLPDPNAIAWVSADPGDDLQRLLECLLAALEPFDPPWRVAPESLVQRVAHSARERHAVAAEFINTLEACEIAHGVLVIDDLHRVEDPAAFAFLDPVVERLGRRWSLALASRTEPALNLARVRAAGELAEFRQLQLRFARDEARQLAATAGLDPALADRVFDRTQGWPAGLRMAIGAAEPAAVERALRSGERQVFEYLSTEVLDQLRPELADFLLRTSVLSELAPARCAEVTGRADAAAMIVEIERLGLFADALEGSAQTLRLHDLFRDAMREQLQQRDAALFEEMRRRAAATEPDAVRRVALLLEAGEPGEAARQALAHGPARLVAAGPAGAVNLIGLFPPGLRESLPELAMLRGLVAWMEWDFAGMLAHFERADHGFAAAGNDDRSRFARAYRVTGLIALGRLAEAAELLETIRPGTVAEDTAIVALNARIWLSIDTGRLALVAPTLEEMVGRLERAGRFELWYHTSTPLRVPGLPGIARPLLRHAELMLREAGDEPTVLRPIALLAQGWCAAWRGDLAQAARLREQARDEAAWSGETGAVRAHLLTLAALTHAMAGETQPALAAAAERLRQRLPNSGAWGRYLIGTFAARVAAACADLPALREALDETRSALAELEREGRRPDTRPLVPTRGQLAWLEGRGDEALALWREALAEEEAIDVYGQASETRVRVAGAVAQGGDLRGAARELGPVFARAQVDGGPGGALLAGTVLRRLAAMDWGEALPAAQQAQLRAWASPGPASAPGAEGLSARELEVLERLAAGDSNKLIARALDLSPHTVKRHVANILGKLGVETRGQAAAWFARRSR
ncbi:MAG: transcriptional regulator [Betaproteobacteria bacterium]|nr:transcriptional regulator [Betaproteobacteria bacterium]